MKSILQEDSSVIKAIAKAWNQSGKPSTFTINILNVEEKGLFGFLKRPAIVSIVYDPIKMTVYEKRTSVVSNKPIPKNKIIPKKVISRSVQNKKKPVSKVIKESKIKKNQILWKDEFVSYVKLSFNDILKIMGFRVAFTISVENKMLNIFLDTKILKDAEDEKMFFISISNILMQFLKRKYKRKFSNYYLIIHSGKPTKK